MCILILVCVKKCFGDYISKNIKDINTNKKHLKYDSTVRIIILNSLDEYIKSLLNNCTSAYLMIKELKERFSETGPSRLFEIEIKIKKARNRKR